MVNVCLKCGKEFTESRGRKHLFCSAECRENYLIPKVCETCGKEFMGKKNQKRCSERCRTRAYEQKIYKKQQTKKLTKEKILEMYAEKMKRLAECEKMARANGMSYGEWTAREYIRKSV